ncbi:MAG: DoxX family membrane protein [Bdellovibrionales bacterium]|nr:DoxX family membrane protein [Bdellovibrionales bacterium]
MFTAFFESFRYTGHLYPFALLRIFVGYKFFESALAKVNGDYLLQPRLAAEISEWLPHSSAPLWYKNILTDYVVENWQVFSYSITYSEFLIAISFILGFFIRPVGLLAVFLTMNYIFNSGPQVAEIYKIYLVMFLIMMWMGAGRCIGFDYFFFKRQRGLWW